MKKIGIITINDYNIGNRLQNYAMQIILSNYGEVETIGFVLRNGLYSNCNILFKIIIRNLKWYIKQIVKLNENNKFYKYFLFEKRYIFFSKYQYCKNLNYKRMNNYFDYYIVGSDQIWNPNFFEDNMYFQMLGFADKNKKIAIAPSIAVDSLTDTQQEIFQRYLSDFRYLSVREQQGADLLNDILNRKIDCLIDPTLMLTSSEWIKISKKPIHYSSRKYIFIYFLGSLTEEYKVFIRAIKNKLNIDIIDFNDYVFDPGEFIWLISNAEFVITDSFHGTVFSYIFDKPIKVFNRIDNNKNMNSRIKNLAEKLKLSDEIFSDNIDSIDSLLKSKYDKSALIVEQKKFNDVLKMIFSENNDE